MWEVAVLRTEMTAWEDVCRGEGGRGVDAVEEEDAIFGGNEQDAVW